MIARNLKVSLGVAVAVLTMAAFSPAEAKADHRGRSFGFSYSSGGSRCGSGGYYRSGYSRSYYGGSRYYGGGGYYSSGYRSSGFRSSCAPRYYCPPPRPIYRPRFSNRCGW